MVVKNVAGLDMAKLMIGSFGTLAAVAVVNFKLIPMPDVERSFLLPFDSASAAITARNRVLAGALQPAAIDLLNVPAAASLGRPSWLLAVSAAGNSAAVDRTERELAALGDGVAVEGPEHAALWKHIVEFTPRFLERHDDGAVVRASCTLKELDAVMQSFEGPAIARAGSGVVYAHFDKFTDAAAWINEASARGWKAVVEFAAENRDRSIQLWPDPGGDLEVMRRIKNLFDPGNLLNHGRLYNRI
jgi:glycolate oxidase FAD binding subunit